MDKIKTLLNEYPYTMLTKHFLDEYSITSEPEYEIFTIPARKLLIPQRIDLMAKWVYIDSFEKKMDMQDARKLYLSHLAILKEGAGSGTESECEDSDQKVIDKFEQLIGKFRSDQFDNTNSLIPIGKNNVLLDGAHRCACAAYYNKEIRVIKFFQIEKVCDYFFFKNNLLNDKYLERMVLEYCNVSDNLYFACLWPAVDDALMHKQAVHILHKECGEIVYEKDVYLGYQGLLNFMSQIYGNQGRVETYENRHEGIKDKANKCYLKDKPTHIVIFECNLSEQLNRAKEKLRDLFCMKNNTVHISDNNAETRLMAELLLNPNSRHHLKYGNPSSCTNFNRLFDAYQEKLGNYAYRKEYIIDSSSVLAVYGLRDCRDLDFLTTDSEWKMVLQGCREIDNHKSQLPYYPVSFVDMLNNPHNYFVYRGVKFVSLNVLKRMKQCRGEEKDKYDVKIINRFEKSGRMFAKPMPLKRERKKIKAKDIIMWLKCWRKDVIENFLKTKVFGKVLLKMMYPVAQIMDKEDKWNNYYTFWKAQNGGK